jgi:phosphoglycerate dehydrogenase-like enzyme
MSAPRCAQAKPLVLLWLDEAAVYLQAAREAGLGELLELVAVPADARPPQSLMARAEAVLAWRLPAGIIASMPSLRWIQTLSAGVESWLARPDLERRITVTCARGIHNEQMPDNIIAAIYHVAKPLALARAQQQRREWKRIVFDPLPGRTLAIIGLGTIGTDLARKAAALGLRVVGIRRTPAPVAHVEAVHPLSELPQVLARADFVVLLLPVTPLTEGLIDARALAAMKPSAWLFNFARGALVVYADLIAATEAGVIAGAVLDVFREEPLPAEHPFWTAGNILVLPHVGGMHPRRDELVAGLFAANARRFAQGHPLEGVVDRSRGY